MDKLRLTCFECKGSRSVESLPTCPNCEGPHDWQPLSGGKLAAKAAVRGLTALQPSLSDRLSLTRVEL